MRRVIGICAVVVLVMVAATGGAGAQSEPEPEPEIQGEEQSVDDGGGALAITHSDDVIIDDGDGISSELRLRDPGTTNDWTIRGGLSGDFTITDPDGFFRTTHRDSAAGDSVFIGRDDVFISASGGAGDGGDVTITTAGIDGDIVLTADGDQTIVQSFANTTPVTEVFRLQADVPPQQVFENTSGVGAEWFFAMTADDQFKISRNGTGTVEAKFFDNGNLTIAGTLTQNSDVNAKTGIEPADTTAVLDALIAMQVSTWEYLDEPDVTHLGPTAQDFAAAFGLGGTTTGIAAIDADGVGLAAIQALAEQTRSLTHQNDQLAHDNDELRSEVAELRLLVGGLLADS